MWWKHHPYKKWQQSISIPLPDPIDWQETTRHIFRQPNFHKRDEKGCTTNTWSFLKHVSDMRGNIFLPKTTTLVQLLFHRFKWRGKVAAPRTGFRPRRRPPGHLRPRSPASGCDAWRAPWQRAAGPTSCRLRRPHGRGGRRCPSSLSYP